MYKHLTYTQRLQIETLYNVKTPVKQIAEYVGCSYVTIYSELKRGEYMHLNSDLTYSKRYSPQLAENKYREHLKNKGPSLKIGNDFEFANFVEYKIIKEKYSPRSVLGEIKNLGLSFKTQISATTLYRYIDEGFFLTLTNKHLPSKSKKRKKPISNSIKRISKGLSIEQRPQEINCRGTFGHWEMDCVEGLKGSKTTLLVLTERYTRYEIIKRLSSHTQKAVTNAINSIERKIGAKKFRETFKTITTDNGSEFLDFKQLETSCFNKNLERTQVFYCHSYCSWEKGSVENANKLIRRHYPKGTNFSKLNAKNVKLLQNWINNYPRGIFGYKTSKEIFKKFCDLDL